MWAHLIGHPRPETYRISNPLPSPVWATVGVREHVPSPLVPRVFLALGLRGLVVVPAAAAVVADVCAQHDKEGTNAQHVRQKLLTARGAPLDARRGRTANERVAPLPRLAAFLRRLSLSLMANPWVKKDMFLAVACRRRCRAALLASRRRAS